VVRSQVERLRYTDDHAALDQAVPFQSVDELLASRRDGNLFQFLLERFATYADISAKCSDDGQPSFRRTSSDMEKRQMGECDSKRPQAQSILTIFFS
jgi:hypothetical protein